MGFRNYINSYRTYKVPTNNKTICKTGIDDVFLQNANSTFKNEYAHTVVLSVSSSSTKTMEQDISKDLMTLVGKAIDEWANIYHMENLPKKIIFEQALTILNAMNSFFDEH